MNMVWNKMETRNLCYGSWASSQSSVKALTFGILVELSEGRITNYRSDLWHDARWIDQNITGPTAFEWVVRDYGTHIGEAAAVFNYGAEAIKYRFELEDNDGKWNITIYEGTPVKEINVPDSVTLNQVECTGFQDNGSLQHDGDTCPEHEEQDLVEEIPGYLETVFPIKVDDIFPSHGNKSQIQKGSNMSYDLERLLDGLREKLDEANSTKDDLEEKQSSIEEAVGDLENYIDEMERIIGSLDELPEVSIYVDLDTVSFDS